MIRSTRAWLACVLAAAGIGGGASAQQPAMPPGGGVGETELSRAIVIERNQRMTLPVRVNDLPPHQFVVDTGAERTIISTQLAEILGLEIDGMVRLATVTGPATVPAYLVERLRIDAVEIDPFVAPALSRGHMGIDGLIGIDSLENHTVVLDFKRQRMEFTRAKRRAAPLGRHDEIVVIGARNRAGRLILSNARVAGKRVDVVIDTGGQGSVANLALKRLVERRNRQDVPARIQGVTGEVIMGTAGQIPAIEFNGMTLRATPVVYADTYAMKVLGLEDRPAILLGMHALEMFDRVEINFAARRVSFTLPDSADRATGTRYASIKDISDR